MSSPSLHTLLLLADSALPLGSFAFSSGLESFLAHKNLSGPTAPPAQVASAFDAFLSQSLRNVASTGLPYVVTAYRHPERLADLDNDMDASTPCTVARRASVTQGRALVQVWTRALCHAADATDLAAAFVSTFAAGLKANAPDVVFGLTPQGHFAPLFGAVCAALCLREHDAAYLFLLNHAKALLSAAVRAGVMGPYQSQAVLASAKLRTTISERVKEQAGHETGHEDAMVTAPTMDLWMGRHELLYSRIFNS